MLHVDSFMHIYQFLLVTNKLPASGFDYTIVREVCLQPS